jgi:hypothetical protein
MMADEITGEVLAEADPEDRMAWRDRILCLTLWSSEIDHYSQTGQTGIAASYEFMGCANECRRGERKGQVSRLNRSSPLRDTNKVEGQK